MPNSVLMPAEWIDQEAVMIAWPHENTDWKPWLDDIEQSYVALTQAISVEVPTMILCQSLTHQQNIAHKLADHCQHPPIFVVQPYNDTWCRDYGPISVFNNDRLILMDFAFNGWGEKYASDLDNGINQALSHLWQAPLKTADMELEGGSIETDGMGTLLTTKACLLEGRRNDGLDQHAVEQQLKKHLGCQRVLWLENGLLLGDDTDSHIDNLARFCSPDTLVYCTCDDPNDPHFEPLQAMAEELKQLRQTNGKPYRLRGINIPPPQTTHTGARLPASYVNFLILNSRVIVPTFGCSQDTAALSELTQAFPDKHIVSVPGNHLIKQFGGPHCATMQLPRGTLKINTGTHGL